MYRNPIDDFAAALRLAGRACRQGRPVSVCHLALIHHEGRHLPEEGAQEFFGFGGESGFGERVVHPLHPAVASRLIDSKREVPRTQAGMPSLGDIAIGTSEAIDQEVAKPLFGTWKIPLRIHGAQNIVFRDLPVEGTHQPGEAFLSDECKYVGFFHG
jgi:hypothetical protein